MSFRTHDRPPIVEHVAVWFGLALAIAALVGCVFAYLFGGIQPASSAETYRVPTACAALAQRNGYPDALTREQALDAKQRLERSRKFWGVALCLGAVNREWKL